jgi:hypothetical protein
VGAELTADYRTGAALFGVLLECITAPKGDSALPALHLDVTHDLVLRGLEVLTTAGGSS